MNGLVLILFAGNVWLLSSLLFPERGVDKAISMALVAMGYIVLTGYLCSAFNALNQPGFWLLLEGVVSAVLVVSGCLSAKCRARMLPWPSLPWFIQQLKGAYAELTSRERWLLIPLWSTVLVLGCINGLIVVLCAPHNWDSMTYHVARVAYFLQQGSLGHYDANYWAQVVHPHNSTLLLIFSYLVSGCRENWMQVVQYLAYWTCIMAVFGTARELFRKTSAGLFAAGCFGLLISALMQATTTQNDLILTALACCAVYGLFRFKTSLSKRHLWIAAMAIGLGLGTKVSFLLLCPAFGVIFLYVVLRSGISPVMKGRQLLLFTGMGLICFLLWTVPSGYISNVRLYGHPVGPEEVRTGHSFEGGSLSYRLLHGTKNMLRFGVDGMTLESLPPTVTILKNRNVCRRGIASVIHACGIDLENREACRAPFQYLRQMRPHEDTSFWGILGFGMIWIMALLSVLFLLPGWDMRVLSLCFFMFWCIQSYVGPYDPWRGRYFMVAAAFGVPMIGYIMTTRKRWVYVYVQLIVWLAIITGVSAMTFRDRRSLITVEWPCFKSQCVFTQDRLAQLMSNRHWELEALRKYEEIVPPDAKVGLIAPVDRYEYPFFGKGMTRHIVPLLPYLMNQQPVPDDLDYIVYEEGYYPRWDDDVHLGSSWWLKRIALKGLP